MQNAANATRSVFQETGTVIEVRDGGLLVETGSGRFDAVCAVSCLVSPEAGDEVLLAVPPAGDLYVLAVLARSEGAPVRLRFDADTEVECAGSLSLLAADALELRSPKEVATVSAKVSTSALEGVISIERLSFVGRQVLAHADRVKGVLGMVDTVLDRWSQKVKRSYRFVEELDMTRARQVDVRAEETVNLRGKNAFMSAEDLVKMQGEQIQLG